MHRAALQSVVRIALQTHGPGASLQPWQETSVMPLTGSLFLQEPSVLVALAVCCCAPGWHKLCSHWDVAVWQQSRARGSEDGQGGRALSPAPLPLPCPSPCCPSWGWADGYPCIAVTDGVSNSFGMTDSQIFVGSQVRVPGSHLVKEERKGFKYWCSVTPN